jgi:hypothetical protein
MTNYYISPTGSDGGGAGTLGSPWQTISKAYTVCATTGDSIICLDGTYSWLSQTFGKNLTVQALNSGKAIFDAALANIIWDISSTFSLIISGIEFKRTVGNGNVAPFRFNNGSASFFTNLTCINCIFHDMQGSGSGDAWNGAVFGSNFNSGLLSLTVTGCLFYMIGKVVGNSIALAAGLRGTASASFMSFYNSTFYLDSPSPNDLFALITVYGGTLGNNILFKNCIIYSLLSMPFTGNSTYSGTFSVSNCDIVNVTGFPTGTFNLSSDPLFVDPSNRIFSLRQGSPCIDSGTLF